MYWINYRQNPNLPFIVLLQKCKSKNFPKDNTTASCTTSITNLQHCNIVTTTPYLCFGNSYASMHTGYVLPPHYWCVSLIHYPNFLILCCFKIPSGVNHGVEYLNGGLRLRLMNGATKEIWRRLWLSMPNGDGLRVYDIQDAILFLTAAAAATTTTTVVTTTTNTTITTTTTTTILLLQLLLLFLLLLLHQVKPHPYKNNLLGLLVRDFGRADALHDT